MRTSRIVGLTVLATVLGVGYVFQQTEIMKFGYRIASAEKSLLAAEDRRTLLAYTLQSLESPANIDRTLLKDSGYEVARGIKLVRMTGSSLSGRTEVAASPSGKRLAWHERFFGQQAEARTLR
jgi:hypothetical protein